MTRFTLHGMWPSGPAYKAALMLRLTDTPHNYVHVNLQAGEQRGAPYLALNRFGQVPVLHDAEAGIHINQSSVILDYLADETGKFGGGSRAERAEANSWQHWASGPLANGIYRTRAKALGFFEFPEQVAAANEAAAHAGLEQLNGFLEGKTHLVGTAATIADIDLYAIVGYAPQAGIDLAPHTNITTWMGHVEALPGFKAIGECVPKESVSA